MTQPQPISIAPHRHHRLAAMRRRDTRPPTLQVLLTLHRRLERVTRTYTRITDTIVDLVKGAA